MSNITIYRFALDMTPGGVTPVVHLSQYDEAFQLEFTLYSRTGELDIPSGATAMIEGTKLDGKAYSANATISGNVVTVAGDVQISAVAGNNPFQIVLKSGNSTVGSANFTISVERAAMDYDTVSDSKLAQIQDVTATAAQLTAAAQNVTDGVETFEALAESIPDMLGGIVDDTLSISGKAADAAKTGEELSNLKSDLNNTELADGKGTFAKGIVANSYVNNRGAIAHYDGWDRTDYLWIGFAEKIKITATGSSSYNCFYDADKNWINFNFSFSSGENIIEVPVEAKYMILSGSSALMADMAISVYSFETRARTENIIDTFQADVNNKQIVVLNESDIEVGSILTDGSLDDSTTRRARTKNYYPILRTENKFVLSCQNWQVAIVEYVLLADGTYSFIKSTDYKNDGFVWWASKGTTHIRLVFRNTASNTIDKTLIRSIASDIRLIEGRSINKYLRVCTFNMARDYPSLTGADDAGIQAQIHNYLNFIGGYNPDVIQAQEAGSQYWDNGNTKDMNITVFNRKYLYNEWPAHNRKTWSKYNISEPTYAIFEHKYGEKTRFYTKMYLHFEGKTICLLNTHCEYEGTFAECREGQFEELATEMAKHEYCILCGDFNAYDPSEFSVFSNYNTANCGDYGNLDTWLIGTEHPEWENKCVDNIITTKNIVIQNVEVGPYNFEDFSDHAPLIADLQIR